MATEYPQLPEFPSLHLLPWWGADIISIYQIPGSMLWFSVSFSQGTCTCGKVTWLPTLFSFIYFVGWAGPFVFFYSLSFFLLSLHEEHCKNMKKLVPDGQFSPCLCECDGLVNCLLHPWVLFLSCDGGLGLLRADAQRSSYQAEMSLSALGWSCGCGLGWRHHRAAEAVWQTGGTPLGLIGFLPPPGGFCCL